LIRRLAWAAAVLAALAVLDPAAAAVSTDRGGKSANASGDDGARAKQEKGAEERGESDVASCKRDADGMRGPQRSRFMTQCLKERK
jgi:hypothetical protein